MENPKRLRSVVQKKSTPEREDAPAESPAEKKGRSRDGVAEPDSKQRPPVVKSPGEVVQRPVKPPVCDVYKVPAQVTRAEPAEIKHYPDFVVSKVKDRNEPCAPNEILITGLMAECRFPIPLSRGMAQLLDHLRIPPVLLPPSVLLVWMRMMHMVSFYGRPFGFPELIRILKLQERNSKYGVTYSVEFRPGREFTGLPVCFKNHDRHIYKVRGDWNPYSDQYEVINTPRRRLDFYNRVLPKNDKAERNIQYYFNTLTRGWNDLIRVDNATILSEVGGLPSATMRTRYTTHSDYDSSESMSPFEFDQKRANRSTTRKTPSPRTEDEDSSAEDVDLDVYHKRTKIVATEIKKKAPSVDLITAAGVSQVRPPLKLSLRASSGVRSDIVSVVEGEKVASKRRDSPAYGISESLEDGEHKTYLRNRECNDLDLGDLGGLDCDAHGDQLLRDVCRSALTNGSKVADITMMEACVDGETIVGEGSGGGFKSTEKDELLGDMVVTPNIVSGNNLHPSEPCIDICLEGGVVFIKAKSTDAITSILSANVTEFQSTTLKQLLDLNTTYLHEFTQLQKAHDEERQKLVNASKRHAEDERTRMDSEQARLDDYSRMAGDKAVLEHSLKLAEDEISHSSTALRTEKARVIHLQETLTRIERESSASQRHYRQLYDMYVANSGSAPINLPAPSCP